VVRSPSRSLPVDVPAPAGRAIVRDFSRPAAAPYQVEFDVRTVYDFVFSLSEEAGATDDLPAGDRAWLSEVKTSLRGRVSDALDLYDTHLCVVLAGLAVDRPEIRDAAAFIDLLGALDDASVAATLRELAEHDPTDTTDQDSAIYQEPAAIVAAARTVLREWLRPFQAIEGRVRAMIRRDADSRAGDRATLRPADLIERTTGGIRVLAEPGIRRIILAPSYFARPYNYVLGGDDWRLFGYPIADDALDEGDPLAPPAAVVRLHRALGDETRLRILRLLAGRDHYLTEIASALELSKPTIKHHLALLRAAGLVTLTEEGGLSYYSLRRGAIEANGMGLREYLNA